jgi:hypothetical protein
VLKNPLLTWWSFDIFRYFFTIINLLAVTGVMVAAPLHEDLIDLQKKFAEGVFYTYSIDFYSGDLKIEQQIAFYYPFKLEIIYRSLFFDRF